MIKNGIQNSIAFTDKGPSKGWRTPLNIINDSEQRDEETEGSRGPFASERGDEPRRGIPYCSVYSYTYFGARYMDPMPTIEEADGGIRVSFQRNNQGNPQTISQTDATETPQKTSQKTPQKTSQKILELIEGNPQITTHEMAAIIGIDRRNIHRNIKKLREQGVLCRVGPDKGGHWAIIKEV